MIDTVEFALFGRRLTGDIGDATVAPVAVQDRAQVDDDRVVWSKLLRLWPRADVELTKAGRTIVAQRHTLSGLPLDRRMNVGPNVDFALPDRDRLTGSGVPHRGQGEVGSQLGQLLLRF